MCCILPPQLLKFQSIPAIFCTEGAEFGVGLITTNYNESRKRKAEQKKLPFQGKNRTCHQRDSQKNATNEKDLVGINRAHSRSSITEPRIIHTHLNNPDMLWQHATCTGPL